MARARKWHRQAGKKWRQAHGESRGKDERRGADRGRRKDTFVKHHMAGEDDALGSEVHALTTLDITRVAEEGRYKSLSMERVCVGWWRKGLGNRGTRT